MSTSSHLSSIKCLELQLRTSVARCVFVAASLLTLGLAISPMQQCLANEPPSAQLHDRQIVEIPVIPRRGSNVPIMIPALITYPTLSSRSPVVIINHGAPRNRDDNGNISVESYAAARDWFLKQGFAVVVPVRRGYGASSVTVQESYRSCEDPDYWNAGHTTANDIAAVVDYLRASPHIDSNNIIVLGQSAGGWGSLALSSRNISGIIAIINFAGGRGSLQRGQVCHPERLVETAQRFGASAKVPTIWLYSENDSFFGPALANSMFHAYRSAGGTAEFVSLPSFRKDGHAIFAQEDGVRLWTPAVKDFLERLLRSRPAAGSMKSN